MDKEKVKKRILDFLKSNRLTVISTIDAENNKPESAVIAFAQKENLELVFGTSNKSRKYKNLQSNQNVSFVIGWSDEFGTVQYEGIARELSGEEALESGNMMGNKNENSRTFSTREDQRYFLVKPVWIRFIDKSKHPEEKLELDSSQL